MPLYVALGQSKENLSLEYFSPLELHNDHLIHLPYEIVLIEES